MSILEAWSFKKYTMYSEACNLSIAFDINAAKKIYTDEASMANSLNTLFETSLEELETIGRLAYGLASSQFNWDTVVRNLILMYKWVLGKVPKPEFIYLE